MWYIRLTVDSNAYDFALNAVLRKAGDSRSLRRLGSLFRNDEAIEKLGLTLLHQTVLGLNELDLEKLLRSVSKASIDESDAQGRSALWWAARRGDLSAMTALIDTNADINKRGGQGDPPLNAAISSRNEACAWLLLNVENIDSTYVVPNGWTALHACCQNGLSVTLLERLLDKGAQIDQPFETGATPLFLAVQFGHNDLVRCMIAHGANLDAINFIGESPLSCSIELQNSQSLQVLLDRKANYRRLIHVDETLLHHAAIFADLECLRILRSFELHDIDVQARTTGFKEYPNNEKIKGGTALEIAMERKDVTPEWREMFRQLVEEIEHPRSFDGDNSQPGESEVFEDALEHQHFEA